MVLNRADYTTSQSLSYCFPHKKFLLLCTTALFRMEFSGRGELSERQQKLGQHLGHLVRLAEEFNIAIVVVSFALCLIVQLNYPQRSVSIIIHFHL